jgi:hypothetical protein
MKKYLPAYEDGTESFLKHGIQNSDAGELPRRKHASDTLLSDLE